MSIQSVLKSELEKISLSKDEISNLEGTAKDFVKLLKEKNVNAQIGGSLFIRETISISNFPGLLIFKQHWRENLQILESG